MKFDSVILVCLWVIILTLIASHILKQKYKHLLKSEFLAVTDPTKSDTYLEYYKHIQLIDVYRTIIIVVMIAVMVWRTDSSIVQALAIAIWAIILVFQTLILSFVVYLMLLPQYNVWETIRVWALWEWEIISIKPLYIWLAGRNKWWEHTGEFYLIPNNKVRENPIVRVDYGINSYQKIICDLYYNATRTDLSFDEYVMSLTEFLNNLLPTRSAKSVGHYKSYIGHKYKLYYEMHESWVMKIQLWFIAKQRNSNDLSRQIFSFVQGL